MAAQGWQLLAQLLRSGLCKPACSRWSMGCLKPVLNQGVIRAEAPVQMLAPGEKKPHRAYV